MRQYNVVGATPATQSNTNANANANANKSPASSSSSGGVSVGSRVKIIGHQHQKPINMNGLTEVTNNMFANIAVWYDGRGTSRMNSGQGDLSSVLNAYNQEGYDFFSNNIWAQTHLYYKLWLTYTRHLDHDTSLLSLKLLYVRLYDAELVDTVTYDIERVVDSRLYLCSQGCLDLLVSALC